MDEVERSRRGLATMLFVVAVLAVVVLPLVVRLLVTDGAVLPGGAGSVQVVLGVLVGVLGSVVQARAAAALAHDQPLTDLAGGLPRLVRVPRSVRRAVLRGRDIDQAGEVGEVGELVRRRVPVWLVQRRRLCAVTSGVIGWAAGLVLILFAGDGGVGEVVRWVVVTAAVMVVLVVPLLAAALLLRRAQRRLAAGGGPAPIRPARFDR